MVTWKVLFTSDRSRWSTLADDAPVDLVNLRLVDLHDKRRYTWLTATPRVIPGFNLATYPVECLRASSSMFGGSSLMQ
jgi:hypothetical protein